MPIVEQIGAKKKAKTEDVYDSFNWLFFFIAVILIPSESRPRFMSILEI